MADFAFVLYIVRFRGHRLHNRMYSVHKTLHCHQRRTEHRVKYIFDLESIRPIRTAENFEAVEWATGFSNKHGCIVGLLKETGSVFVKVRT